MAKISGKNHAGNLYKQGKKVSFYHFVKMTNEFADNALYEAHCKVKSKQAILASWGCDKKLLFVSDCFLLYCKRSGAVSLCKII